MTRQKKTEDRTRELRKKARRPSGQCKDGRARIKRTSTRETLPETTRRPQGLGAQCTPDTPAVTEVLRPGRYWHRGERGGS